MCSQWNGGLTIHELMATCSADTARWFPGVIADPRHHTLGLCGEAGEFANVMKKIDRGSMKLEDFETREALGSELADVLIYVAILADMLDIDLEEEYGRKRDFNERRFGPGVR